MAQIQVELTPENIEIIRQRTNQKWRDCQRKEYNIFAIAAPAGYVFANSLEQPDSYRAICKINKSKNPIISVERLKKNPQLAAFLKQNGCYETTGERIILCGTRGEMWDVKPEKFVNSYRMPNGNPITQKPLKWCVVSRASENAPSAMGIQLPKSYLGKFVTSWGATLFVNNMNSAGHGDGDIIVVSKGPDGLNFGDLSTINNEVFALTFNQNIGGWNRSGLIKPVEQIVPLTLEYVRSTFIFGK